MRRNETHRPEPRRNAERDASQPMGGQPRTDDDEDALENPGNVPSFLTARELQARDPARKSGNDDEGGDRHGAAAFSGTDADGEDEGEPAITDEEPPRGERGLPMERSDKALRKGKAKPK